MASNKITCSLTQAADWINAGGVLAYPTEAVYGLGCNPFNPQAFERLLQLKQRPLEKGVILIAASVAQVTDLVKLTGEPWETRVRQSWAQPEPPTTWVLPATDKVPSWISGGRDTVAVRVTHHPQVKALCRLLGQPLVSTSANLSGQAPAKSVEQCQQDFPQVPVLEGALGEAQAPSQIWSAQTLQRLR